MKATGKFVLCVPAMTVILAALVISSRPCRADKGGWGVHSEPVVLTESGQKAIIGWDGQNQILCLATDVSASRNTHGRKSLSETANPSTPLRDSSLDGALGFRSRVQA